MAGLLVGVLGMLLGTTAHAECLERFGVAELDGALADARAAYWSMDLSGFQSAVQWAEVRVACQGDRLGPTTIAEFHRMQAYAAFVRGEREAATRHFRALRSTAPGATLPLSEAPASHPLRLAFDDAAALADPMLLLPVPTIGSFRVDGYPTTSVPTLRPYVWQHVDDAGVVMRSRHLDMGGLPDPVAPPPTTSRAKGAAWWIGSAAAIAGGSALVGSAYWGTRYYPNLPPWERSGYYTRALSWRYWGGAGLVIVGGAGVVTGAVRGLGQGSNITGTSL